MLNCCFAPCVQSCSGSALVSLSDLSLGVTSLGSSAWFQCSSKVARAHLLHIETVQQCLALLLFERCNELLNQFDVECWAATETVLWNLHLRELWETELFSKGIARWLMRVGSVTDYKVLLNWEMTTCLGVSNKNGLSLRFGCHSTVSFDARLLACLSLAQTRMSDAVQSQESIVHEKLVCRLTKLRVSTCEAVLWEKFDKLTVLAKTFCKHQRYCKSVG